MNLIFAKALEDVSKYHTVETYALQIPNYKNFKHP
jgi:hypothetical protein